MAIPYVRSANYDTNAKRGGDNACAICGKRVRDPNRYQIVLGRGGCWILSRDEYETEGQQDDCLGAYPIGSDCATLPQLVGCVLVGPLL